MAEPIRVTVWGEYRHERSNSVVGDIYPRGMHTAIAAGVAELLGDRVTVRTATLDDEEHGLTGSVLAQTDVLTWWGHKAHGEVSDEVAARVRDRVLAGMGLLVLHSGHESKVFRGLMGTTCALRWREAEDRELVWTVDPSHPIADGVPPVIALPRHEMYGEYFDIPPPERLVFISSFSGGEVFRSGCCFTRGTGRIFYFSPGHETYPIYHHHDIRRVIANAVVWLAPRARQDEPAVSLNSPTGWFEE